MEFFAHLTANLFAFYYVQGSMTAGAASVVGGGKLLLNTAFPRLLMPFAAVRTAFFRWLPTFPVYIVFHIWAGNPIGFATLAVFPFLIMLTLFSMGLAAFFGALQVYFRDTTSFLPYFSRIWLYGSPVLWETTASGAMPVDPRVPLRARSSSTSTRCFAPAATPRPLPDGALPRVWRWPSPGRCGLVGGSLFLCRGREFAVRL